VTAARIAPQYDKGMFDQAGGITLSDFRVFSDFRFVRVICGRFLIEK
jgi:hypothetical protein